MVLDYSNLRTLDQKTLFETLGVVEADVFKDDPKKPAKTTALYELIKEMMEPEPSKRPNSLKLLSSIVFEIADETDEATETKK